MRLLEQQSGPVFRLADDPLAFLLGLFLHVVRQPLRRQEGVAQGLLALAVFVEDRFHLGELLAELIGLAERLLVVVGDRDQKCGNLDLVEAVQAAAETPLAEVEGSDVHAP